jgi:uncharacterized Zn finger protein
VSDALSHVNTRVGRETAATRARRLLIEGRVMLQRIDDHGLLASVRGDSGAVRSVAFHLGQWSCDCPARGERCAHVRAVQLVVAIDLREPRTS